MPINSNTPQNLRQQPQSNLNGAAIPFSPYGPFPPNVSAGDAQGNPQQPLQGPSSHNLTMPQPPLPVAGQSNAGAPQGQSYPPNFAMPQQTQPGSGQSNLGGSQSQSFSSNLAMPQPPQPGVGPSNVGANANGSQSAQRFSVGGNQPYNGHMPPVPIPTAPNQRQQDPRMSMGSIFSTSERMEPPPIIPPPTGGLPSFPGMSFNQSNLGHGVEQPLPSSQANPLGARGGSIDPTQFSAYSGQGQHTQAPQTQGGSRASLSGSQQPGNYAQPQVPRSNQMLLNPGTQTMVNRQLQSPLLQGLSIPLYPAPPDISTGLQQSYDDNIYLAMLTEITNSLHQWSQIFDGIPVKTFTPQHESIIRGCLDIFSPMEPGIVTALNMDQLSIEGMYYSPTHRRILAEHILALNIHIFIFSPFFPGVEVPVGKLLAGITDHLYTNRMSFPISILMFQLPL